MFRFSSIDFKINEYLYWTELRRGVQNYKINTSKGEAVIAGGFSPGIKRLNK